MKKILALILAMASIASMLVMPVFAEETSTLSQDQTELLTYVGVYDAERDMSETITKGEFAGLLAKVAFGLNKDSEMYATGQRAADVKEDHLYYTEICALLSSGYIATNKFGSFLPDTALNINTAYEFILRTMGYSETEDFKAGKYARLAAQKDLSDGLVGADKDVTFKNAYILIYNMLFTDISDMMSLVYNHISSNKKLLYMENKLDLFQAKGIVTDDGLTSMHGESKIKNGYISIENDEAMLNSTGLGNLIGKNVVAYFTPSETEDGYEIVCLYERADKSAVYVLKSENIIAPYQNRTYSYYDDEFSAKVKKLKVDSSATVIYNERALRLGVDTFDASDFIPQNGIVRLYDNNNDGIMDIVRIEDYQIAIASVVDKASGRIDLCFKDTGKIYDLTEISYQIYDEKGNQKTYDQIREGAVVSILESLDGNSAKMLLCTENETTTIKSSTPSTSTQRGYITTADGGKYFVSDYLVAQYGPLVLGGNYKFYFDVFGAVVYVEKLAGPNDYLAGMLIWIKRFEDMGGEIYAKIYNDGGKDELVKLADKVLVIGEDDSKNQYSAAEAMANVTYQGVMRYKINKNDEIHTIELPLYYGTKPTVADRLFCLFDTITEEPENPIPNDPRKYEAPANHYLVYTGSNINISGAATTTDTTKIFLVPNDKNDYKEYRMTTPKLYTSGSEAKSSPKIKAYSTNFRSFKAEYIEVPKPNSSDNVSAYSLRHVKSVKKTINPSNGDVAYYIETLTRTGTAENFYVEPDLYETGIPSIYDGYTTPIQLAPGDAFYHAAEDGYIKTAFVAYDADQECSDSNGNKVEGGVPGVFTTEYWGSRATGAHNNGNPFAFKTNSSNGPAIGAGQANGSASHKTGVFVGWVYSYEDGLLTVTNQNPASGIDITKTKEDGAVFRTLYKADATNVIARPELGRVRNYADFSKGTTGNIKPYTKYGANCSRILVFNRSYAIDVIVLINKN